MPAKCPNCITVLSRGDDGEYPPNCPSCGVRLRTKSKVRTAASVAPPAPAPAPKKSAEPVRVVRSFSAGGRPPQSAIDAPAPADEVAERPESLDAPNPFQAPATVVESAPPTAPVEDENPFGAPVQMFATSPFAPTSAATADSGAAVDANPFGASAPSSGPARRSSGDLVRWIVAGVLVAAAVGGGFYFFRNWKPTPVEAVRDGYRNAERNYILYALDRNWKRDGRREIRAGLDIALNRQDLGAWVTLRTERPHKGTPLLGEVADRVVEHWKDRLQDVQPAGKPEAAELAGRPAEKISGKGMLDGSPVLMQVVYLVDGGLIYELGFEAAADKWESAQPDFDVALKNFELLGARLDDSKEVSGALATFNNKKYPYYRLQAPGRTWREAPDYQTFSRFDDLKLLDKTRVGEVSVAPRKTDNLAEMKKRYIETQAKWYDNKLTPRPSEDRELMINGKPAQRIIASAKTASEEFFLLTAFIRAEAYVYVVQCRCPAEKRGQFEPVFDQIIESFEVVDKGPPPPAQDETAKKADEPPPKPTTEMKKAPETPKPEQPAAKPSAKEPEKKPEMKPEPKGKRKSLDDLDDDKPAKKKDGEKKKEEEKTKDEPKKPDAKKKKALDDLD